MNSNFSFQELETTLDNVLTEMEYNWEDEDDDNPRLLAIHKALTDVHGFVASWNRDVRRANK